MADSEDQSFTITADDGYSIADVKIDGVSQGNISSYIFENISGNHSIEVTFSYKGNDSSSGGSSGGGGGGSYVPTYPVNTPEVTNGSITFSKKAFSEGETVKFSIKVEQGYEVNVLVVKDEKGSIITLTQSEEGTYAFKMPKGKVSVEARLVPQDGATRAQVAAIFMHYTHLGEK